MKLKILKLLLLFPAACLFVSSKETVDKSTANCNVQYLPKINCSAQTNDKKQTEIAGYQFSLAPGSYIFFY